MQDTPFILYVTFRGTPETRFDRTYYVEEHLPLVTRAWQATGLESIAAFFPAQAQDGTIAICECRFRDAAAFQACFASAETPAVMADIPCFTDVQPVRLRATPADTLIA